MGAWLSWLANADEEPLTKDEKVQQKLMDYIKRLKADLHVCESSYKVLEAQFETCKAQHGIGSKLRACFNERQTVKKQTLAVQASITAVSEQLNTLYQQNLNHETMLLMRESAMIMLKTGQKGMNPDKTLNIMDDFNSTVEEKTELAAHMFAAVKDSVHAPQPYDESWDSFVAEQTGNAGGQAPTPTVKPDLLSVPVAVPAAALTVKPDLPSVPVAVPAASGSETQKEAPTTQVHELIM